MKHCVQREHSVFTVVYTPLLAQVVISSLYHIRQWGIVLKFNHAAQIV